MSTSVFSVEICCRCRIPNSDLSFVYRDSSLEHLPRYLQFAHGWVWLILIKFNLFSHSIWKRPKCCLPSVWELSDKDGWAVDHLCPGSRCGEGTCVWCALAFVHPGPHTWLVHPTDCQFIHFCLDASLLPVSNQQRSPSISSCWGLGILDKNLLPISM